MNPSTRHPSPRTAAALLALVILLGISATAAAHPPDPLADALQRARAAGAYAFTTDLTQTNIPASTVTNVGRTSKTTRVHLEGETNLRDASMQMRLWSDGGSVSDPSSGVAVKIEDGKTYLREGAGAWVERDSLTEGFAPDGDFLAYLIALRDPVAHAPETRNDIAFTRYTFRLDGPALAEYLRDQTEEALRQRGELPASMHTEAPAYYREMAGDGELWVGEDGLPLRQILRMRFPEEAGEVVHAEIVTNYARFGTAAGSPVGAAGGAGLLSLRRGTGQELAGVLAALAVGVLAVPLLTRRRRLVPVLIVFLVALLVFNPLASSLQIAQASDALAARAAEQEALQGQSREQAKLRASLAAPQWDPHANPLAVPALAVSPTPPAATTPAPPAPSLDPAGDVDDDGLTNFEEAQLDTDPHDADSDDDGVSDRVELDGFTLGGVQWFMDPNNADSNDDGSPDTLEYDRNADGAPDDTDADLLPDVFDDDNDGDGVPDRMDLAAFAGGGAAFSDTLPLSLTINGLTSGKPVFVDVQLRPVEADHLWYALNVLDWPKDDVEGQLQDKFEATFGSVRADAAAASPGPRDFDGDIRLIPALEVVIPDGQNLPPAEDLTPYGISVGAPGTTGTTVHVPLSVTTDPETGARVAFNARMRYLPGEEWGAAHAYRLVWLVQMLNDVPCDYAAHPPEPGCTSDGYIHNKNEIVQVYDEPWQLTGLNVTEDHGAGIAMIYEDPAPGTDSDLLHDDALFRLSVGLDETFLTGRDLDGNGRDIDLAEVVRRFDHLTNAGVTEVDRLAVPNILRVERRDYATLDEAVMTTAMTETGSLLDRVFAGPLQTNAALTPLILFAQEARFRGLSTNRLTGGSQPGAVAGGHLVFDFAPDAKPLPVETLAGIKWMAYCPSAPADPNWAPCPLETWWPKLAQRYSGNLPGESSDAELAAGRLLLLRLYFMALTAGISRVVEPRLAAGSGVALSDEDLTEQYKDWAGQGGTASDITMALISSIYAASSKLTKPGFAAFVKALGKELGLGFLFSPAKGSKALSEVRLLKARFATVALVALLIFAFVAIAADYYALDPETTTVVAAGLETAAAVLSFAGAISAISSLVSAIRAGSAAAETASTGSKVLGVIGFIIAVAIVWVFFVVAITSGQVSPGDVAYNSLLGESIAMTIYVILLVLIAQIPYAGWAIVAIILLLDGIAFVCKLLKGSWCFSASEWLVGQIRAIFNASLPMIHMPPDIQPGSPHLGLDDPAKGYVAGQTLSGITMTVATTVSLQALTSGAGLLANSNGPGHYTAEALKRSSFRYSLTSGAGERVSAADDEMKSQWQVAGDATWGTARATTTITATAPVTLTVGRNAALPLWFNIGYAIPTLECWGFLWWGTCSARSRAGSADPQPLDKIKLDVLPSTAGGLMALREATCETSFKSAGSLRRCRYALAWDAGFPPLADADGDGLRHDAFDPNDSRWDTDGDGLSDRYEVADHAGAGFLPFLCDTDSDGLTDAQEARAGSAPNLADTDGDGLTDAAEVRHVVYSAMCRPEKDAAGKPLVAGGWRVSLAGGRSTWVDADPLRADTDADGISDRDERELALAVDPGRRFDPEQRIYHPRVANTAWIELIPAVAAAQVAPGAAVRYSATVSTRLPLADAVLEIALPPTLGGEVVTIPLQFAGGAGQAPETVTAAATLDIPAGVESARHALSSRVYATVVAGAAVSDAEPFTVTMPLRLRVDGVPPTSQLLSPAAGSYVQAASGEAQTLIIGGSAADGSGIERVEVSVDDSSWQAADGQAAWSFPLPVQDGAYRIRTRAVDRAGNIEVPAAAPFTVLVDGRPPVITFAQTPPTTVALARARTGAWTATVGGALDDPPLSGDANLPGSGVDPAAVDVELTATRAGVTVSGGWQRATVTGSQWTVRYELPAGLADPSGVWTVTVRAADKAGNAAQQVAAQPLLVDNTAPAAALSLDVLGETTLSRTARLSGVVSDTVSGVARVDASFAPLKQVEALSDAAVWLDFEDPSDYAWWTDRTGQGNSGHCVEGRTWQCATTVADGRRDRGLLVKTVTRYDGYPAIGDRPEINAAAGGGLTAMTWFRTTHDHFFTVMIKPGAYSLQVGQDGKAIWQVGQDPRDRVTGRSNLLDGAWHHLAGSVDSATGRLELFVDGELEAAGEVEPGSSFESPRDLLLALGQDAYSSAGGAVHDHSITLDDVVILRHAAIPEEVAAVHRSADRKWFPAALAAADEHGNQAWDLALPPVLEGAYQIDLRSEDGLGNGRVTPNAWRGTIDTLAPRISLAATFTGDSYVDPLSGQVRAAVRYVCQAEDTFLDGARFRCPRTGRAPAERSFDEDPIRESVLPGLTVRNGLAMEWTQWEPAGKVYKTMEACDLLDNCTPPGSPAGTVDLEFQVGQTTRAVAVVTAPTDGSYVISDGPVPVTVVASAPVAVGRIALRLDGQDAAEALSSRPGLRTDWHTFTLTPGEGEHTLTATASDVMGGPGMRSTTTFTLDAQPPAVAISTTLISIDDIYHKGSSVVRFAGSASDTVCLAAVQLRVGEGPFQETTIEGGAWSTVYLVDAPEGQILNVSARATDCAGRMTETTRSIRTSLTRRDAPDTKIIAGPVGPSRADGVTFSFRGVRRARDIGGFMCRLDKEPFTLCTSPVTYNGLTAGLHTFQVRAYDVDNWVDWSPARRQWTVRRPPPQPTGQTVIFGRQLGRTDAGLRQGPLLGLPGWAVTATLVGTGARTSTVTNALGRYRFTSDQLAAAGMSFAGALLEICTEQRSGWVPVGSACVTVMFPRAISRSYEGLEVNFTSRPDREPAK